MSVVGISKFVLCIGSGTEVPWIMKSCSYGVCVTISCVSDLSYCLLSGYETSEEVDNNWIAA